MSTDSMQSLTSRGFGADVVPRASGPTLDPSELVNGAVVKVIGSERKEYTADGQSRSSRLHTFQLPVAHGAGVFSLWGSVQLDQKLRALRPGGVVLIQYEGRDTENGKPGQNAPHKWTVRPWTGSQADLRNAIDQEWPPRHHLVNLAIAAARERQAERQSGQGGAARPDAPPPHTDDDAPLF